MKTKSMPPICGAYSIGSTQNSLKKSIRPNISTGVQNTMTVAMAMRMFAPHEPILNCLRNIRTEPAKHIRPTMKVTG